MKSSRFSIIVIFFFCSTLGWAQSFEECLSFIDKATGKYGFKEKSTGEIIIPAEYEKVSCSSGKLFPVYKDGFWYVVDSLNKPVTPTNKMKDVIIFYKGKYDDEPRLYGLTTHYNGILTELGSSYYQYYPINLNCDCVPENMMFCPFFVDIDTSSTPEYLKLLQKSYIAAKKDFNGPLAYKYWKQALASDPDNPYVDYFMATLVHNDYGLDLYYPNYNAKRHVELITLVDSLTDLNSSDKEDVRKLNFLQWHLANLDEDKSWSMKEYFMDYEVSDTLIKHYDFALDKEKKANEGSLFYWQIRGARLNAYQYDWTNKEEKNEFKALRTSPYKKEFGGTLGEVTLAGKGFLQNGYQGWGVAAQVSIMNLSAWAYSIHYGLGYDRFMKENSAANAVNLDMHAVNLSYFFGDMGRSFGVRPTVPLSFWRIQLEYGYQFMFGSNNRDLRGHHIGIKFSIPIYNTFRYVNYFYSLNSTLY
jgi:hypothetical protein